MCRLSDSIVKRNAKLISELDRKGSYKCGGILVVGSWAEGLALEDKWGHPQAARDVMRLEGSEMIVHVPVGHRKVKNQTCLTYRPEGCPVGYTKLEVTDVRQLSRAGWRWWHGSCVLNDLSRRWLNTYNTVRKMAKDYHGTIGSDKRIVSGPAVQRHATDTVPTLVCNSPHPDLEQEFCERPRGQWPSTSLINFIRQLVMLLVLVGYKHSPHSEFRLQARISWSVCELALIRELPGSVRQGYIACKYVLKRFLAIHRGRNEVGDGRSCVGSYHIKSTFLHFLEKTPKSLTISPFRLFLDLLLELDIYLQRGKLPHYFMTQCNLLETVGEDERCMARQAIEDILSDPVHALLSSPTDPQQIYGEVRPADLLVAFRKFAAHPICEQSRSQLSVLLACVDECRQRRYSKHQELDEKLVVYERTKLVALVDSLKQIKPI